MNRSVKIVRWSIGVVLLLLVVGCLVFGITTWSPGGCTSLSTARVWIDCNENGEWDDSEQSLPGVQLYVVGDSIDVKGELVSDEEGKVTIFVTDPSCRFNWDVCAETPAGYHLTTERCLERRGWGLFHSSPAQFPLFGFSVEE